MILINQLNSSRIPKTEVVERKGIGHPDTLADGIAEELSRKFCIYSLKEYQTFSRYFFDKVLIYGGFSEADFGRGHMKTPFRVVIPAMIPDDPKLNSKFIKQEAMNYLKENLHEFSEKFCRIVPLIYKSSRRFYEHERASDSSIGVGYYPLSKVERIVLETEQFLNMDKKEKPFLGEDIKILALKNNGRLDLTLACSFISKYIENRNDYFEKKRAVEKEVKDFITGKFNEDPMIKINPDDNEKIYLSFLGSCIDHFAVGVSGKGNNINGVISSSFRPTSPEGVYGKNIVRHPGRIYNVLASLMAKKLTEDLDLNECYVQVIGVVGENIYSPHQIIVESPQKVDEKEAGKICDYVIGKADNIRLKSLKQNICKNPQFLFNMQI